MSLQRSKPSCRLCTVFRDTLHVIFDRTLSCQRTSWYLFKGTSVLTFGGLPPAARDQHGHPYLLSPTTPPHPLKVRSRACLEMPWDGEIQDAVLLESNLCELWLCFHDGFFFIYNGHKCGDLIVKDENFSGVFTSVEYRELILHQSPEKAGA